MTLLFVLVFVAVFFVSVAHPHMADKIQKKTNKHAGRLKRTSNWLWNPLTWWAENSIEFVRKAIVKIAERGKKTRGKFSPKKNTDK